VTGDPLWATVSVSGDPFNPPTTSAQTNPATGYYSLTVAGGQAYTLTVSALLHTAQARGLGVPVSDRTENFALAATTTNGGIVGWVKNYYTSQPIVNALVTVQASGAPSDTTDSQGYFEILGLAAGVYTATATAPLYSPVTINNIQVLQSNLAMVTFSLPTSHIDYAPPSLQKTVTLGAVVTDAAGLVITSTGLGDLTYELVEWRGGFAPVLRHTDGGGPDPYGYTWKTLAEADARPLPGLTRQAARRSAWPMMVKPISPRRSVSRSTTAPQRRCVWATMAVCFTTPRQATCSQATMPSPTPALPTT